MEQIQKVGGKGKASVSRIYCHLKFFRSESTGKLVAFVTKNEKGKFVGVRRESEAKKMVVVIDRLLEPSVMENVLYHCTLVKMEGKHGYVAIHARPVQFLAHVDSTYIKGNLYVVTVKFGNKKLRFDPCYGVKDTVKDIGEFKEMLRHRVDIRNMDSIIEEFDTAARLMVGMLDHDRYKGGRRL